MSYKTLNEVLDKIITITDKEDREISGIALDSRKVKPGDLFIAYCGTKNDGRAYIDEAIAKGARAVVSEGEKFAVAFKHPETTINGKLIPIFIMPELRYYAGIIASKFYDEPSKSLQVIGVTGTNGKTSCAHFLAHALSELDISCGVIGTLGVGFPDNLNATLLNTTPDPVTLQQKLAEFKQKGAKAVTIEVSSHSLHQDRIAGIQFTAAIFTNLTRDHLDYHRNMENYYLAKKKLFLQFKLQYGVINCDDDYGKRLLNELSELFTLYAFSAEGHGCNLKNVPLSFCEKLKLTNQSLVANLHTPWGKKILHSNLLGGFNLSNLLAVFTTLGVMDVDLDAALATLAKLKPLPGRMQSFGGRGTKPLLVVDFAHTPDALEKALLALREHCEGALWCVFGCGGDRDRGKRPLMGKIAEHLSDQVIITDDNPRTEDSRQIVEEIVAGLLCPWAVTIEHDRKVAITHAIDCAKTQDIVLVAGKGHENYQIIGDTQIPFNDAEIVQKILNNLCSDRS